ncbi:MAG: diaminopimelate epimerase [Acidobacteriota bacterium]
MAALENQTFYRLSGAGNDFIALASPDRCPTLEERRRLCSRGLGLGADGLLVLTPGDEIALDYFNADGERAELCINGTRSAAQLAFRLGWAKGSVPLRTDVGRLQAVHVDERSVRLEAPLPSSVSLLQLEIDGAVIEGHRCTVGVPHLIVEVDDLRSCDVVGLGAQLRRHPETGPEGTNVDFVRFSADRLDLRTFERGVEGETLACGTGMLAAAAVGLQRKRCRLPLDVGTRGGCVLRIDGRVHDGAPLDWSLEGDARVVARGEIWTL